MNLLRRSLLTNTNKQWGKIFIFLTQNIQYLVNLCLTFFLTWLNEIHEPNFTFILFIVKVSFAKIQFDVNIFLAQNIKKKTIGLKICNA